MLDDLYPLFNKTVNNSIRAAFGKKFEDIVIKNRDARVLYGENGNIVLAYMFLGNDTLLIMDNISVIDEVIARLGNKTR